MARSDKKDEAFLDFLARIPLFEEKSDNQLNKESEVEGNRETAVGPK
jgi:hypothetical protein